MEYKILGTLEIRDGTRHLSPTAPKVRQVLAALLLRANQFVSTDSLMEEVWGHTAPASATTTLQTYVYHLRKLLGRSEGAEVLGTRPLGYTLRVAPESLDAIQFETRFEQGRLAYEAGDLEIAVGHLRGALGLWRCGGVAADVRHGDLIAARATTLEEMRMQALELRISAEAALGRHRALIPELRALVRSHPLHEWAHGQLISALAHVGRRAEALHAYHQLRHILGRELGLDPSPETQQIHSWVLRISETA